VAVSLPGAWREWFEARSHLPFMERELLALDVQADVESVEARDAVPLQWHGVEEVFGSSAPRPRPEGGPRNPKWNAAA
jgi:hypothetical protein